MKKLLLLLALTTVIFLTGCVDFHDAPGVSVWSEGLWILPWATGIGAAICLYNFGGAYLRFKDYKGKKKLSYGWLIFAGALVIATIAIIWKVISER